MSNPLSREVIRQLEEKKVRLVKVSGFRHNRPQMLTPRKPTLPTVLTAWRELPIPRGLRERVEEDYVHTSYEPELEAIARGFVVLNEKPLKPPDFSLFFDMLIRASIMMPDVKHMKTEGPITVTSMMSQQQSNNSAGLLNLNTLFGSAVGSKKEMHYAATAVNIIAAGSSLLEPGCLPYKPVLKNEVKKKMEKDGVRHKKNRVIQVESQANTMVFKHFFEPLIKRDKDVCRGMGIGISTLGGGFKQIIMNWYLTYLEYHDSDWNQFLEWLDNQMVNESDKEAWESSTNMEDGLCYLFYLLCSLGSTPADQFSRVLLTRALSDYVNPAIQIDSDRVVFCPWKIPSGSFPTAHGSTFRHRLMLLNVCDILQQHGGYGKIGCKCRICQHFGWSEKQGPRLTPFEIAMMRESVQMGDDSLGIDPYPHLTNAVVDFLHNTTTKTEKKRLFSVPGLHEPEGAEFLKKYLWLDTTGITWNVRTFRAPTRLLAKLYHGEAVTRKGVAQAAVLSAIWEAGANRPLHQILVQLFHAISDENTDANFEEHVSRYVKRTPALFGANPVYVPTFADILNSDNTIQRPLASAIASRRAQKAGTMPTWYE